MFSRVPFIMMQSKPIPPKIGSSLHSSQPFDLFGNAKTAHASSLLHKPFVSSRILTRNAQRESEFSLVPGFRIPDKPTVVPKPGEKRGEGVLRGPKRKLKKISPMNYEPSQVITMDGRVYSIHTVAHELGREIVAVRFATRIEIHALRKRTVDNDEFFTMEKVQECLVHDDDLIESISIGCNSNIGYGVKKLVYAFSLFNRPQVYYAIDQPLDYLPFQAMLSIEDYGWVKSYEVHNAPVHTVKFDGEKGKFLASLAKESVCKVWNMETKKLHCSLTLDTNGVDVIFHKSEQNKVLIAERNGWLKFYSLVTFSLIYSIKTGTTLCADWSVLDPVLLGTGQSNCINIFNIDELNSEPNRTFDSHGANKMIKLSTADRFVYAVMSKPKNDIRVFHANMKTPLWIQRKEQVQWIEWVYGKPYLMACVGDTIQFYEASLY